MFVCYEWQKSRYHNVIAMSLLTLHMGERDNYVTVLRFPGMVSRKGGNFSETINDKRGYFSKAGRYRWVRNIEIQV